MLERTSFFYGKEAAVNQKPRNADYDKEFNMWVTDMAKQMELVGDDFMDHFDHMIDCWENGYDAYKRGDAL